MKKKHFKVTKRLITGLLAVTMLVSAMPPIPVTAEENEMYPYTFFAGSGEEGAISIHADNFCVNGNVGTNGTIVSHGNMSINGTKTEHAEETLPDILEGIDTKYFSQGNVEEYADDYVLEETNINIDTPTEVEGEVMLTGNINISTALKAVDDVLLNGEVKNTNSSIICSETGSIIIDSQNVNLNGLVYAPKGTVDITTQNLNLNSVIIIADKIIISCPSVNANYSREMAAFVTENTKEAPVLPDITPYVYAFGTYDAEKKVINLGWFSNCETGTSLVMESADNVSYTTVAELKDVFVYDYPVVQDFEKKYFKIAFTYNGQQTETMPFVMVKSGDGYTTELLDSDEDQVPDAFENIYGTDNTKSDSDGDGVSDYEEIMFLYSDPAVYDSVTTGISDADADSDNDGLSNRLEIDNNCNPLYDDSDEDGLLDGEEIHTYGTDPLNPDTDGDTLTDWEEVKLGLDPKNPATDGTPDGERVFTSRIPAEDEIFADINGEDSPYLCSVEVKSKGYAGSSMSVSESGYSQIMSGPATLGSVVEFDYARGVEELTVKFEIKDGYRENVVEHTKETLPDDANPEEFDGIKRLQIFQYFEEYDIMLPIETFHDVENNTVYATTDSLGSYCLVDMEIWMASMEENGVASVSEPEVVTEEIIEPTIMKQRAAQASEVREVYIHIFCHSLLRDEYLEQVRKDIINDYSVVIERNSEKLYIVNHKGEFILTDNGENYVTDRAGLEELVQNITSEDISSPASDRTLEEMQVDVPAYSWKTLNNYFYGKFNAYKAYYTGLTPFRSLYNGTIKSTYIDLNCEVYLVKMVYDKETDQITYPINRTMSTYYYVTEDVLPDKYIILTAAGLKCLPELFGEISPENEFDYDGDSLKNNEEINWESPLIRNRPVTSETDLPTLKECIDTVSRNGLTYVEPGLERLKKYSPSTYAKCCNKRILPISSDPLSGDGDGDGLLDGEAQEFNGERIAPIDQNKLKYDGPKNLWKTHIETAKDETIPRRLDGWYGNLKDMDSDEIYIKYNKWVKEYADNHKPLDLGKIIQKYELEEKDFIDLPIDEISYVLKVFNLRYYINASEKNSGIEGLGALYSELMSLIEEMEGTDADRVSSMLTVTTYILHMVIGDARIDVELCKMFYDALAVLVTSDKARASLGSRGLNFKADNRNVIHSQFRQWQAIGGYNNLYDEMFGWATRDNMDRIKFSFSLNGMEYILWVWRGDYLNIGAGAEIGIYERPLWMGDLLLDHHFTIYENVMPMELYLYDHEGNAEYTNIFSWKPDEKQWWITGFNPEYLGDKVDAHKQVLVGCVDFTGKEDMFEALCEKMSLPQDDDESKYLIFDEEKKEVWICWYKEGVLP